MIFVPDADDNGSPYADFDFTVNDGTDDATSPSTITINVLPLPDLVDDAETTNEDTPITFSPLADDDIPNPLQSTLDTVPGSGSSNGTLTIAANGDVTYTPDPDFSGMDTVEYVICDQTFTPEECDTAEIILSLIHI